jgi:hypothetical protein
VAFKAIVLYLEHRKLQVRCCQLLLSQVLLLRPYRIDSSVPTYSLCILTKVGTLPRTMCKYKLYLILRKVLDLRVLLGAGFHTNYKNELAFNVPHHIKIPITLALSSENITAQSAVLNCIDLRCMFNRSWYYHAHLQEQQGDHEAVQA